MNVGPRHIEVFCDLWGRPINHKLIPLGDGAVYGRYGQGSTPAANLF